MEKTAPPEVSPFAAQCMLSALKEVQDTIRAYDTKAQIVGVGFIFSIGIITAFAGRFLPDEMVNPAQVVVFWVVAIGPIVMFGAVLYPTRKVAPKLGDRVPSVNFLYYYRPDQPAALNDYIKDLHRADWVSEIGYEIVKLSGLREIKRRRFLWALSAAGASYVLVAASQIVRAF
ncbi:MAG: hypothetical protein MJE12_11650 [Alphaproteobacteria bacterium]|nr:hypothetical protein [Alphaproteobacteria bacterium]